MKEENKPVYYKHYVNTRLICIQDLLCLFSLNSTDSYNQLPTKICKENILQWAGLRRSISLSVRSYGKYPSINSPKFVVKSDNIFDVPKWKSKDYYNLLIREKAKPPNIIKKLQSNFHFNSDHLKQIFKLPHSIVVGSYVKAFQYKVINSILYINTKLYKIGFKTNDLCTFCDNQPESLTHLFYHCSRSKQFWIEFELYWCLISNQRIRLCLENVLFGILTENACPLLQLLNYFIIIGKLYLWDCRSKQILPNIYGFRAKIIAKYETEEKISNKEFFKRKWILTLYLS